MEKQNPAAMPPAAYVNFLRVGHDRAEFRLAFGQLVEQGGQALLLASLVTTPAHAKAMAEVLAAAVERYETAFGKIPDPEPPAEATRAKAARPRAASPSKRAGAKRR